MDVFVPILAEIADKMPTLDELWVRSVVGGGILMLTSAVFSMIRLWLGGVMVILCLALGILFASSGGMVDELIVRELGTGYLYQERLSWFVPFALSTQAWLAVRLTRRPAPCTAGQR